MKISQIIFNIEMHRRNLKIGINEDLGVIKLRPKSFKFKKRNKYNNVKSRFMEIGRFNSVKNDTYTSCFYSESN